MAYSKTVKIVGAGADAVKNDIAELDVGTDVEITVTEEAGETHIHVLAKADDESEAKKIGKPVVKQIKARYGAMIYTTDDDETLEQTVVELLDKNSLTISTAESCTGGLLSGRIINVPGASEIIKIGIVTYSNRAKRKYLGVRKSTLEKYGAVSPETAKEMVKGLLSETKADVGLSTTGIAGPDGGTAEKPVGLVYIGCNVCGNVRVKECRFTGDRMQIRQKTVTEALNLLRLSLLEYFTETKLK